MKRRNIWARQLRRNKYNNKVGNGRRSLLEHDYEHELKLRVKAGELTSYRYEQPIRMEVNGTHVCTWKIDWTLTYPDGRVQYVETKGFEDDVFRIKHKLARALFPDRDIVILKRKDVREYHKGK